MTRWASFERPGVRVKEQGEEASMEVTGLGDSREADPEGGASIRLMSVSLETDECLWKEWIGILNRE